MSGHYDTPPPPFPCARGESTVEVGRTMRRTGWIAAIGVVRFEARALTRIRFAVYNPRNGWHQTDIAYSMVRDLLPALRRALAECEREEFP